MNEEMRLNDCGILFLVRNKNCLSMNFKENLKRFLRKKKIKILIHQNLTTVKLKR